MPVASAARSIRSYRAVVRLSHKRLATTNAPSGMYIRCRPAVRVWSCFTTTLMTSTGRTMTTWTTDGLADGRFFVDDLALDDLGKLGQRHCSGIGHARHGGTREVDYLGIRIVSHSTPRVACGEGREASRNGRSLRTVQAAHDQGQLVQ